MSRIAKLLAGLLNRRPRLLFRYPNLDRALCTLLLQDRLRLPRVAPQELYPELESYPICLHELPKGEWSTPLTDLILVLKLAVCTKPTRVLEVGSFRGYTALCLARHLPADSRIVTIDKYPDHGEAYRSTPYAERIERRVGKMSAEILAVDHPSSYDFIYLDGDHSYRGVKRDTELILPLLASEGLLLWHDYANWGYTNATNGVPECLHELSRRIPIVHLSSSRIAVHSPCWMGPKRSHLERAVRTEESAGESDPWISSTIRG